ncbi:MAG: acyl-[acyl-carrier-protein]--UDP-N-acetylglucosamine O-acyltransferase, partial [Zetaproteobacteria bacterium]
AALGGHVEVGERAILGGLVGVHQFCRVGRLAMLAGLSGANLDAPPFCLVAGGYRPRVVGLNLVGLRRAGIGAEAIARLKRLLPLLLRPGGAREDRIKKAREIAAGCAEAEEFVRFVETSERGVLRLE